MRKFIPWILSVVLMTIILTLTVSVDIPIGKPGRSATFYVGSILTPWPAYATVDYQCDGVDDHIQIQQALAALPVNGGKIVIYAGNYHLGATVSRAIGNIVIEGVGSGTYLANNGVTNIFNVGVQTRWIFKDIRVDNGGISIATATEWSFDNVWIGAGYVAKRSAFTTTQNQDMANKLYVDGAISAIPVSTGNVTGSGLANRIVKWVNSTSIGDGSNTDAQVAATVLASHTQGTDTTLGTMSANITMSAGMTVDGVDVSAHSSRQQWGGADQLNMKDLQFGLPPLYFMDWKDTSGYTSTVTGTGSLSSVAPFTQNLRTGATVNSTSGLISTNGLWHAYTTANFRSRFQTRFLSEVARISNYEAWIGSFASSTVYPTATSNHVAVKIIENVGGANHSVIATNADGVTEKATTMFSTYSGYGTLEIYIKYMASDIKYYYSQDGGATWTLGATHTTNRPTGLSLYSGIWVQNLAAADKRFFIYPIKILLGDE